jgi:hypothetical protein
LKTLEKINRKGNRNSTKIGKANSAQGSPLSLARARARAPTCPLCLTGGSRLSAQPRAPSLPRSLAAPWDRSIGAVALTRARSLSLSLSTPPTPLVSVSLTSHPRSPRRGRATSARSPATTEPRTSFEPHALLAHLPSSICALCLALSLSLMLCPREPRTSATARRRPPPVPWLPLRPRPVQSHGELCLAISFSGHPSVCPFPPWFCQSALTGVVLA